MTALTFTVASKPSTSKLGSVWADTEAACAERSGEMFAARAALERAAAL